MEQSSIKIATDIVVERIREGKPQILLIQRGHAPYEGQWALPGGMVEEDEEVAHAARRELEEETGLKFRAEELQFIDYFDAPDRDPRGRVISFAFGIRLRDDASPRAGSDAARTEWFALNALPDLAFDHRSIVAQWEKR